jgi:hypothetical protein
MIFDDCLYCITEVSAMDSQLARTAVANLRDKFLRETIGEPFLLWAIAEVTKGKHSEDEWPLLGYRRTGHS